MPIPNAVELDSKAQPRSIDHLHYGDDGSDVTIDTDDDDDDDDLPPPYEDAIRSGEEISDEKRLKH